MKRLMVLTALLLVIEHTPSLLPRQPLANAAYAMNAHAVPDSAITSGRIPDGTMADKSASSVCNPPHWLRDDTSGTTPTSPSSPTTDNQTLNLRVNNLPASRMELMTRESGTGSSLLGGDNSNTIPTCVASAMSADRGIFDAFDNSARFHAGTDCDDTVVEGSMALAAIQSLYRKLQTVEQENALIRVELEEIKAVVRQLQTQPITR
jgi:hypothetical protein